MIYYVQLLNKVTDFFSNLIKNKVMTRLCSFFILIAVFSDVTVDIDSVLGSFLSDVFDTTMLLVQLVVTNANCVRVNINH